MDRPQLPEPRYPEGYRITEMSGGYIPEYWDEQQDTWRHFDWNRPPYFHWRKTQFGAWRFIRRKSKQSSEEHRKENKMGKRIWAFINSPIVILLVGSLIVGKGLIIPVMGTQPSIPITLGVILIVFLVMTGDHSKVGANCLLDLSPLWNGLLIGHQQF